VRRVLFITGSRSDWDILYSVIKATQDHPHLEALLVVSGAHLSASHGDTLREIERDGLRPIARLENLLSSDRPSGRAKSAAIQCTGLVDLIEQFRPDILFAAMDREEAMSMALAGSYLGLPLFHLGGGDITGDRIDDRIREAVSALSHFHLTHTEAAKKRLLDRGEDEWRVQWVGAPGLDRWSELRTAPSDPLTAELWDHLNWKADSPYVVVLQHPEFGHADRSHLVLETLSAFPFTVWIGHPNSDPGSHRIKETIANYCRRFPDRFRGYGNLPRELFAQLLGGAAALIGNSSCGVIEAPFLGIPVVNLGNRQAGRDGVPRLLNTDYDLGKIKLAIERAVFDRDYRATYRAGQNVYGDGRAGKKIADLLATVPLDDALLDKRCHRGEAR
jgi:GDP/UDP-N,N'-diacetylbacillosamine 2-epimerase (hydrolysing)